MLVFLNKNLMICFFISTKYAPHGKD